jgi:hypothetical protein
MSSKIDFDANAEANLDKPRNKISDRKIQGTPEKGAISDVIGTGDNARNSFVWIAIRWSFIVGVVLCVGIFFHPAYCKADSGNQFFEDVKAVWGIFVPIITMALGYAFGKSK